MFLTYSDHFVNTSIFFFTEKSITCEEIYFSSHVRKIFHTLLSKSRTFGKRHTHRSNIVWVKMNNTGKWPFYDHFWPFFANCMVIFHKTEVHTVILMCLMGLNSNWFKGYDTKSKYFHFGFLAILYKNMHLHFLHFCVLCHNFWTN